MPFSPVLPEDAAPTRNLQVEGLPFEQVLDGARPRSLSPGELRPEGPFDTLYLLGMTTERPEGSEWWGQAQRFYSYKSRVHIGDRIGRINVVYQDRQIDVFPVIFGVSVWAYELLEEMQEADQGLNNYGGPFPEPFVTDAAARALRDESLVLYDTGGPKDSKYILALAIKPKAIKKIQFHPDGAWDAGFRVTAVTGAAGETPPPGIRVLAERWYANQQYHASMDRLARRLYQFADEIPDYVPYSAPDGYDGPKVTFGGDCFADLSTNIYAWNIDDMRKGKVEPDGTMRTSTPGAPSFGSYVGFGTYRDGVGAYAGHVWTRDVGRSLIEALESGERVRAKAAAERTLRFLYDKSPRHNRPNWKRIANAGELDDPNALEIVAGKENDGHGTMMLFLAKLFAKGVIDGPWVEAHWQAFLDAANWIEWQVENPAESFFDKVLYSESEASTQIYGGHDIFSNTMCMVGLRGFAAVAQACGHDAEATRWRGLADLLWDGILAVFTNEHPRHGRVFVDHVWDCWTFEYKRFAPLFLGTDLAGLDPASSMPEVYQIARNTYQAQREDYFEYDAGRQMGYGQGYITQAAILLDEFEDMAGFLQYAAGFCTHHTDHPWIVPEGVICHPSGRFWFRNGDLGNSVQQAEIIKACRLLLGIDDAKPGAGVDFVPRLPQGWDRIAAESYPVVAGGPAAVTMQYESVDGGYRLRASADREIPAGSARFGPFPVGTRQVRVSGAATATIRQTAGHVFAWVPLGGIGPTGHDITVLGA